MSKQYVKNLETGKIELQFSKSEYLELSEADKKELRSYFLFAGSRSVWVSRSVNNHYGAVRTAEKLGFTDGGKEGERISFAEQMERKTERAEARAERYEQYAENAEKRAERLQAELNSHHGDIAFFTQPIIAGHSGSQAFANRRRKIYERYERGFEEYRKSEYFRDRAETAQTTADNPKLKDAVYLHNRIKECNSNIKKMESHIVEYEGTIERIEKGETLKNYKSEPLTVEKVQKGLDDMLDRTEAEIDKLAYFENAMDEVRKAGRKIFAKSDIEVGYVVKIRHSEQCEILTAGPVNVTYKILTGGAAGMVLTAPYAEITEIVAASKKAEKVANPFKIGDILCKHYGMDSNNAVYRAYQVIKITDTGVKLQQIAIKDGKPIADSFTGEPTQKKVIKSKYSDYVGVYEDGWQLHEYTA